MTRKKMFLILLSVFTAACSVIACIFTFNISAKNSARESLETEIRDTAADTEIIIADSERIKGQISEVETELSTRDTVNGYYMEYKKTHDSLSEEISVLKSKIEQLEKDIEEKKKSSGSVSETKKGKKYALSANKSYSCPDKIPAGRYLAEGSGQLTVLNSSGRARISQNLSVAYGHSYTFDLSSGERVQVSEDITLTELK